MLRYNFLRQSSILPIVDSGVERLHCHGVASRFRTRGVRTAVIRGLDDRYPDQNQSECIACAPVITMLSVHMHIKSCMMPSART